MSYYIQKFKTLDTPMFRVEYMFKYHKGSYPITNWEEAIFFIKKEFGKGGSITGEITYAVDMIRTEIAEMVFFACKEMVKETLWKEDMDIHIFTKRYKGYLE